MENASQMMTVSELFIYRSLFRRKSWIFVLMCMFKHNFYTFWKLKQNLLKLNIKLIGILSLVCPCANVFITAGKRHITYDVIDFMCFILIAHFSYKRTIRVIVRV